MVIIYYDDNESPGVRLRRKKNVKEQYENC